MKIDLNDEFYTKLRKIMVPVAIQNFMLALVSAADAAMLGAFSQDALSAVTLSGQIQFVMNILITSVGAGMGILCAQYYGKQDMRTISRIVPSALRANLVIGFVFTMCAALIPGALIRIFTDDLALAEIGTVYINTVSLSYLLCSISQVYLELLKNTGRPHVSSRISACTVVFNIIGNAVLIFGLLGFPRLGAAGAAAATVVSRGIELIWSVIEVKRDERLGVKWKNLLHTEPVLERDFWKYTFPVFGAGAVWGFAFSLYSVILGHMGSDAVAANSVTSIVRNLLICVNKGCSAGAAIMVGNLLGAGKLDEAKECGRRLVHTAMFNGMILGAIMLVCSFIVPSFVSLSERSADILRYMMRFSSLNIIAQAVDAVVLNGIFTAGGDAQFDVRANIGAMWLFTVPLGFLAAFRWGFSPAAVYCMINMDEITKLPAVFLRYRKYVWLRNLTRKDI